MFFWQRVERRPGSQRARLSDRSVAEVCTSEELIRLEELRTRFVSGDTYREFGLDPRRVEFARWLLANGKLSEDL